MITEEIKEKIVNVFGYSSEKEIDELFYESNSNTPMDLLIDFITHCSESELKNIRELMLQNGITIQEKIKGELIKQNITITEKLTRDQQQEILNTLFGFSFVNTNDDHWVLLDEEGEEFYGWSDNTQFDFSTLAGIFSYNAYLAKRNGYLKCQFDFRKVLGL